MLPTGCTDNSIRIIFIGFHDLLIAPKRPEELTLQIRVVASRNNNGIHLEATKPSSGAFVPESQLVQATDSKKKGY